MTLPVAWLLTLVAQKDSEKNIVVIWPENALPIFLTLIVLGFLVIRYWLWTRPCDTCGESPRENCRCKGREY
jgi:hypothetical protein